jgi:hypothetical protein
MWPLIPKGRGGQKECCDRGDVSSVRRLARFEANYVVSDRLETTRSHAVWFLMYSGRLPPCFVHKNSQR